MSILINDTHVVEPLGESGSSPREARSAFARHGLSTLDVLMSFAVLAAMCAYTPFLYTWFWAPRMAIVLATVLPGMIALGCLARGGDRAARLAVGFLAWTFVSAMFSDNAWLSLRGTIAQNTFVLSYAAALGLWALAHYMSKAGRRLMLGAVLVGVSLNGVVGAIQIFFQLDDRNLGLSGGRAVGLTPNPIELAALMLVGLFICLVLVSEGSLGSHRLALLGLFGYGSVLSFTSTRIALIAFLVVSIGTLATRRNRNQLAGFGFALLGVVSGTVLSRLFGSVGDVLSRSSTSNPGSRGDWWVAGWHALMERPVLGWGVGRFRSAIQGELPFGPIAANGDSQAIPDAHNIFVSMAVELGVPGMVLLVMFGFCVARRTTGVYALALIAVPIIWLLQPIALTTVIVYMILLGIAVTSGNRPGVPTQPDLDRLPTAIRSMLVGATVVGMAAAGWFLVAEYRLSEAAFDFDGDAFDGAAAMYFGDPIVSDLGIDIWAPASLYDPDFGDQLIERMAKTVDLEPTRAYWRARLAWGLAHQADYREATAEAHRALDLQPTSALAWQTLLFVSDQTDDDQLHLDAMDAVCRLRSEGL